MSEFIGLGTQLKIGDGATPTEAFTLVSKVTNLDWSGRSRPAVRTTNMQSAAEEYIAGVLDSGEISGEFNYIPGETSHEQMETDFEAGTLRNFELIFNDGTTTDTNTFAAVITELNLAAPMDDVIKASFRLKISGAVTEAQA